MPSSPKPHRAIRQAKTTRLHRVAAFLFFGCTIAVFLTVAYLGFTRTSIIVAVIPEEVTTSFAARVVPDPTVLSSGDPVAFAGTVNTATATAEKTFSSFSKSVVKPAKALGTVTITNQWTQPQPLAVTTRLLSDRGVLFRTKAFVTVPARGAIDVAVEADQPGSQGDIGPSRFTIPGLSRELQVKITGASREPMEGGLVTTATLTEDDLSQAYEEVGKDAETLLREKLAAAFPDPALPLAASSLTIEQTTRDASAKAGEEVKAFTASVTLTGTAIGVNEELVQTHARTLLQEELEAGRALTDTPPTLRIEINESDEKTQSAIIAVTASAQAVLTARHALFAPAQLTRKTREELKDYFAGIENVQWSTVVFSPFWSRRTPSQPSHIDVRVEIEKADEPLP